MFSSWLLPFSVVAVFSVAADSRSNNSPFVAVHQSLIARRCRLTIRPSLIAIRCRFFSSWLLFLSRLIFAPTVRQSLPF
ncbi:MAG: hypothetical protein REDVDVYQ_001003 [Candidatus Fervidibacter sp.]